MSGKNSLLKNIFTFGVSSATLLFLFLLTVIAARYLGPEDFGIFTFALAFVFFFDFLLDPGLYHLLIREMARHKEETGQYLLHAFAWKLFIIPVVFLLVVIVINITHDSVRINDAVYLMVISAFIRSIKDVYRCSLLANEGFKLEAISSVIEKGGLLLIGSLALVLDFGLFGLCWSFVIVRVIDLAIIHLMTKQYIDLSGLKFHLGFLIDLLKAGVPIGAYYVTLNVYNYVDTVMISVIRDSTEVGWYSASYKVYEGLLIVPVILGTVLLPRLSSNKDGDREQFNVLVAQGWKYVLILAFLVTAVGVPLSSEFVAIVYGESYADTDTTLQILLYGVAFAYMVNFLQTVLISLNLSKVLVTIALLGLFLNVIFNYFAIHAYGYIGAAAVTVLVQALVFMMFAYYIVKVAVGKKILLQLTTVVICWLLAAVPDLILVDGLSSIIHALIWSITFAILLRVTKVINDNEWQNFSSFFRKITSKN